MLFKSVAKGMGNLLGGAAKRGAGRAAPIKRGVVGKVPANRKAGPAQFGGLAGAIGSLGMRKR